MPLFGVEMRIYSGGGDRAASFKLVIDAYEVGERANDKLLDSSFSYTDLGQVSQIDVEVTVEAESEDEANSVVQACVRAAIHAAEGATPDWDESGDSGVVVYRLVDLDAELIPA